MILRPRMLGWETTGMLARVSLAGGAPRELLDDVEEADWTPDGQGLLVVRDLEGRRRLEYPIDNVLYQTAGFISSPRFSPKGDLIAFVDHDVRGDSAGRLAVVDLSGKKRDLGSPMAVADMLAWKSDREIWVSGSPGARLEIRAIGLDGRERLVWREAGEIQLHDIGADGRALVTRISRAREIAGRAPGAAHEVSLSWLDWSFPVDLTRRRSQARLRRAGRRRRSARSTRSTSAPPTARPPCAWARAVGSACPRTARRWWRRTPGAWSSFPWARASRAPFPCPGSPSRGPSGFPTAAGCSSSDTRRARAGASGSSMRRAAKGRP